MESAPLLVRGLRTLLIDLNWLPERVAETKLCWEDATEMTVSNATIVDREVGARWPPGRLSSRHCLRRFLLARDIIFRCTCQIKQGHSQYGENSGGQFLAIVPSHLLRYSFSAAIGLLEKCGPVIQQPCVYDSQDAMPIGSLSVLNALCSTCCFPFWTVPRGVFTRDGQTDEKLSDTRGHLDSGAKTGDPRKA